MKLLGIKLYSQGKAVNKILKPGWYPFGAYKSPEFGGYVEREIDIPDEVQDIYTLPESGPEISVSAIVGKNGSGKSSLVEILFRIINNFAIVLLGAERARDGQRWLRLAYGVYADLHFEINGQQHMIECRNIKVSLFHVFKDSLRQAQYIRKSYDANRELKRFFYTIVTNYSLYAYNQHDYAFEAEKASNRRIKGGEWLSGLFHKNDGYFTPIVLTPYRTQGNLDINKESQLAAQRILRLAIMAEMFGKHLIPNYKPEEMTVSLKNTDLKETISDLEKKLPKALKDLSTDYLINIIYSQWHKDLGVARRPLKGSSADRTVFNAAMRYLAVKTLKVALSYKDYGKKLCKGIDMGEARSDIRQNTISQNVANLTAAIRSDFRKKGEHNHLTLKIEQTCEFIEDYLRDGEFRWHDGQEVSVDALLQKIGRKNYSQIFAYLPPPIFDVDVSFLRLEELSGSHWDISSKEKLTLSQMSSGERQLLYSISYVLYHLKNIESIQEDEDRVAYEHICLIFDEIELYFHPEYQRTFISRLVEALGWSAIDGGRIKSIQILLITHSPFILTDVFNHNILYLDENGKSVKVSEETFGANYYTLFNKSFFFDKSAVGDFSSQFLRSIVEKARNGTLDMKVLPFAGDRIIRNIAVDMLEDNR